MSVNAISSAMIASVYISKSQAKLPDWLVDKLLDLGIDPSNVQSAAQAQQIIRQTEKSESSTDSSSSSVTVAENTASVSSTSASDGSSTLMERLETLAKRVGVTISEDDDVETIVNNVQDAIDSLLVQAAESENALMYALLKDYQLELNYIITGLEAANAETKDTVPYIELLAQYNKAAIFTYQEEEENKPASI